MDKTVKAPEKIYLQEPTKVRTEKKYANDVEYTRTDTFIEKACNLLVDCIEDFMARRMEIWDEECKKQTLENLRKALKEQ